MCDKYGYYLGDLGFLLLERAVEAKQQMEATKGTEGEAFEAGRSLAYYEVVSLMLSQAMTFEIPAADLRMEGVDPDRDFA